MSKKNGPIQLALAEDHLLFRETLIYTLQQTSRLRFMVKAKDGEELIEKIRSSPRVPDICLLDIKMPRMNGFETVAILKEKWPEMAVLIVSAYPSRENILRMLSHGADGFVSKFTEPETLKESIESLYQQKGENSSLFRTGYAMKMTNGGYPVPVISAIEMQLLRYSVEDLTFEEIGRRLKMTPKSIEGHRQRLYAKLGIKNRVGLALYAIKNGYVHLSPTYAEP